MGSWRGWPSTWHSRSRTSSGSPRNSRARSPSRPRPHPRRRAPCSAILRPTRRWLIERNESCASATRPTGQRRWCAIWPRWRDPARLMPTTRRCRPRGAASPRGARPIPRRSSRSCMPRPRPPAAGPFTPFTPRRRYPAPVRPIVNRPATAFTNGPAVASALGEAGRCRRAAGRARTRTRTGRRSRTRQRSRCRD